MASFTTVLLLAACAALLVGSEGHHHAHSRRAHANRRNANDATVALGDVSGSEYRALNVLKINGPDVILGFPDVCDREDRDLKGTLVVVSNNDQGGQPAQLSAIDKNNPKSNLAIHCDSEDDDSQCAHGFTVTTYQFCSDKRTTTTSTTPSSSPTTSSSENVTYEEISVSREENLTDEDNNCILSNC
ncbi:uncharacterized protein [Choristoneura fumiferana]|uniref:uncharacterized protein n=1 Tax=Choristoneura fumiferana TaxID=7141 RepID=UPI003D156163